MDISASLVKELREKTGAGMMDCKKVLIETGGDLEKAIEELRKKGLAAAAKKASRIASEGLVGSFVAEGARLGAMVEVNCETDFVGRNEEFQALVRDLARQAAEQAKVEQGSGSDLLATPFVADPAVSVTDALNAKIAKIGEKIDWRRFVRYTAGPNGMVGSYIHLGGKIGVLIEIEGEQALSTQSGAQDLVHDLAMQVAASSPSYMRREQVPAEEIERERAILAGSDEIKTKPEAVRLKIVEGRLNKFYEQVCLLEQAFIKDPGVSVADVIRDRASKLGGPIVVKRFQRFVLGEGLEKRSEDFAAEVMAQLGK